LNNKKKPLKEHIEKCNLIHNYKYNYDLITEHNYINNTTKITIICPEHGEFKQSMASHKQGSGCPKCGRNKKCSSEKSVIENFKKIHHDKYDYSKVNYKSSWVKITIICPEHGEFKQTPSAHKRGSGCPKCAGKKISTEHYEELSIKHNNKYKYTNLDKGIITIICPEHGEFKQLLLNHKNGSSCPKCSKENTISKGETKILKYLEKNNISFKTEYKLFDNYRFDFYLEDYNLVIEYDGELHYIVPDKWGGKETLLKTKERDEIKNQYCKDNNIYLLRIPYWEFNNIEKLIQEKIEYIYIKGIK
jgi:very-short-patch-repair endonuclease/ribosomal protein S27AE